MKTIFLSLAAATTAALFVSSASADEATATATATVPAPVVVVRHTEEAGTDHDKYIGHFAVGYFGISQLPIATVTGDTLAGFNASSITAPIIGARYWKDSFLGFDVGLGIGAQGSSVTTNGGNTTTTVKNPGGFGLGLHVGVPLALASSKHFTFEAVPEATIGFTSGTFKAQNPMDSDTSLSGFRFDIGARAGAEIHFGFIGLPELALEGSVGLYFHHSSYKASEANTSNSYSATQFGTNVGSDPWAIFSDNISALYYF